MKKRLLVVSSVHLTLLLVLAFLVAAAVPPPVSQSSAPQAATPSTTSFLPYNDGSVKCSSSPDRYDSCYFYPSCWMNGGSCGGAKPLFDFLNVRDYECLDANRWLSPDVKSCRWAKCSRDTLVYSRACGRDGDCRYTTTGDCNRYDGPYSYPQCWLGTGGGEIDSTRCAVGVEPTADGFTHDYTCREKGSSAKCVGKEIREEERAGNLHIPDFAEQS